MSKEASKDHSCRGLGVMFLAEFGRSLNRAAHSEEFTSWCWLCRANPWQPTSRTRLAISTLAPTLEICNLPYSKPAARGLGLDDLHLARVLSCHKFSCMDGLRAGVAPALHDIFLPAEFSDEVQGEGGSGSWLGDGLEARVTSGPRFSEPDPYSSVAECEEKRCA